MPVREEFFWKEKIYIPELDSKKKITFRFA